MHVIGCPQLVTYLFTSDLRASVYRKQCKSSQKNWRERRNKRRCPSRGRSIENDVGGGASLRGLQPMEEPTTEYVQPSKEEKPMPEKLSNKQRAVKRQGTTR